MSFRIDWFDLLVLQGTLKSLFQHHSSKASILLHSDFFNIVQIHVYHLLYDLEKDPEFSKIFLNIVAPKMLL